MRTINSAFLGFGTLLGTLLAAAAPTVHAMPADKFFQKTAPSVWRVFTYDADDISFAQGSAVVIGNETLLTNCHVLAKAKRFVIRKDNISFDAKLQHIDVERDLCQITARNLTAPAVPVGDSDKLAVGQKVYALGNPENLELTLSEGLISSLRKDETTGLKYIQITAPISQGSSGGGLFDEEGRLIGITTAVYKRGQNLNFAMPINYLQELPARSAEALAKRSTGTAAAAPAKSAAQADGAPAPGAVVQAPVQRPSPSASGYADVNDVGKLAKVNPRARAAYEDFLAKPLPRAFALSENGGWWASVGNKPKDPNASADPALRAVPDCEKRHQRRCFLYAVDDKVVWNPANVIELRTPVAQKGAGQGDANADGANGDDHNSAELKRIVPAPAPALAHRTPVPAPTGFAALKDVDAVPLVGPRGRELYREYLDWQAPKAIAISQKGALARARNSPDAMKLALENCEKYGSPCKLYAVDNNVVWVADRPAVPAPVVAAAPATAPAAASAPAPAPAATNAAATAAPVVATAPPPAPKEHMFTRPAPSGFADAADNNAIPFLSTRGREGFQRYLGTKSPKAFAIGADGSWNFMADDPRAMKTAIERCEARGATCWLYAVDNEVVWREEASARVRTFQLTAK